MTFGGRLLHAARRDSSPHAGGIMRRIGWIAATVVLAPFVIQPEAVAA